mmetsp:Transcript_1078/g.2705  ORF Transcript_1078/g.2705 Transcript_1078/m.2705 type:complete len:557 (-) Transcript_1078:12-1682(-)
MAGGASPLPPAAPESQVTLMDKSITSPADCSKVDVDKEWWPAPLSDEEVALRRRAGRLLESLGQLLRVYGDVEAWENEHETAFTLLRRGILDGKSNSMLEAPIYHNRQIEGAWLFLIEMRRRHPNRKKHIIECAEILGSSYNWSMVLRGSRKVHSALAKLPDEMRQEILEAASAPELFASSAGLGSGAGKAVFQAKTAHDPGVAAAADAAAGAARTAANSNGGLDPAAKASESAGKSTWPPRRGHDGWSAAPAKAHQGDDAGWPGEVTFEATPMKSNGAWPRSNGPAWPKTSSEAAAEQGSPSRPRGHNPFGPVEPSQASLTSPGGNDPSLGKTSKSSTPSSPAGTRKGTAFPGTTSPGPASSLSQEVPLEAPSAHRAQPWQREAARWDAPDAPPSAGRSNHRRDGAEADAMSSACRGRTPPPNPLNPFSSKWQGGASKPSRQTVPPGSAQQSGHHGGSASRHDMKERAMAASSASASRLRGAFPVGASPKGPGASGGASGGAREGRAPEAGTRSSHVKQDREGWPSAESPVKDFDAWMTPSAVGPPQAASVPSWP